MYLLTPFMISCENFEAFKKVRFVSLLSRRDLNFIQRNTLHRLNRNTFRHSRPSIVVTSFDLNSFAQSWHFQPSH
jgi:hypothetical protein